MQNIHPRHIIDDHSAKVRYQIFGHRNLSPDEQHRVISKLSLRNDGGTATINNSIYKIVKVIAGDGWEDAE
jgi:hypothetical protein